jgi:hypothetical protein
MRTNENLRSTADDGITLRVSMVGTEGTPLHGLMLCSIWSKKYCLIYILVLPYPIPANELIFVVELSRDTTVMAAQLADECCP